MSEPSAAASVPWEASVSVREASELEAELVARLAQGTGRRAIGVTDLLALRRAYYRLVAPGVPIAPERQARLAQGRTVHRLIGARLGDEGLLEARVRREGVVGRVDILSELPIEVKTAASLVGARDLIALRPDHVEQLGMYCALLGRTTGRLLTLTADERKISDVQALDLEFADLERVLEEMRVRADLLRSAWAETRPETLPRCPWYGRGCEFEEAKRCACTGDEIPASSGMLEEVRSVVARDDVRERVRLAVAGTLLDEGRFSFQRFREVLYPRRAYFERIAPMAEVRPVIGPEVAPSSVLLPDLFARLTEALESGRPGEVSRLRPRADEPDEEVVGFRGRPVLTRTSRAWSRYRPEELVERSPQYALELGFRCAVTGAGSGLLAVGFERAETDRERVQVLELRFGSLTPFSRIVRERRRALVAAIEEREPSRLLACPEWMVSDCPYRAECGCAGAGSRVTR